MNTNSKYMILYVTVAAVVLLFQLRRGEVLFFLTYFFSTTRTRIKCHRQTGKQLRPSRAGQGHATFDVKRDSEQTGKLQQSKSSKRRSVSDAVLALLARQPSAPATFLNKLRTRRPSIATVF